jgi:hypothetical protein
VALIDKAVMRTNASSVKRELLDIDEISLFVFSLRRAKRRENTSGKFSMSEKRGRGGETPPGQPPGRQRSGDR